MPYRDLEPNKYLMAERKMAPNCITCPQVIVIPAGAGGGLASWTIVCAISLRSGFQESGAFRGVVFVGDERSVVFFNPWKGHSKAGGDEGTPLEDLKREEGFISADHPHRPGVWC